MSAIERIRNYCKGRFEALEIIVVDDGSTDGTGTVVCAMQLQEPLLRIERLPVNKGKGAAVRVGMLAASGDLLLMCDADMSTPIEEIEKLLPWISLGSDIVIGSRALRESCISVPQPIYRSSMGKVFGWMARNIVVGGIRDPQCGFKLFTAKAARDIFKRTLIERFAFDVEVLFLARKLGYSIKETGIIWSHSPESKVRLFADSFRMAMDLCRILSHERGGRYGTTNAR